MKVDGGYLPADVKHHKTVDPAKKTSIRMSGLARPAAWWDAPGLTAGAHHYEDSLQLAHYTRMLQACGFHPGEDVPLGAVIGTSRLAVPEEPALVFVWYDLSRPTRPTFSRTRGKVKRSVLERYDHEHSFRVKVAATALRITGSAADPEPLVVPIGQKECGECPYELFCAEQMGPNDASAAIVRDRLDVREWRTLRRMGISTTGALAGLDPDDAAFFAEYYPEVTHRSRRDARKRLHAAMRQARMICEGVGLEPIDDTPVEVPGADIEIDFDIEWDTGGRIYQWGLRVRDGQDDRTARYEPVVSFEPLDDAAELALAERVAAFIVDLRAQAQRTGQTVAVYHWHHVEVSMSRKFACMTAALDGVTLDLRTWFNSAFRVRRRPRSNTSRSCSDSSGPWTIRVAGSPRTRSRSPAVTADVAEARRWCLRYNESDVAAQAAIRDGLRAMF